IIALGGDDRFASGNSRNGPRQFVASSDVSGQYGDDEASCAVYVDYGGVGIFVTDAWGDASDTDTQCADEDDGSEVGEMFFYPTAVRRDLPASFYFPFGI